MKKLVRKIKKGARKVLGSKAGKLALPVVGAPAWMAAKAALAASDRGSLKKRALRGLQGAAKGATDYFEHPAVKAAAEIVPVVKPVAKAAEAAARFTERASSGKRVSAGDVRRLGVDAANVAADVGGVQIPEKARKVIAEGHAAAGAIERGEKTRANLRRVNRAIATKEKLLRRVRKK